MRVPFDRAKKTELILIPGFVADEEIEIEVKRPSMIRAMALGKIPNELVGYSLKAFGFSKAHEDTEDLKSAMAFPAFYCELCMVNPTYNEVADIMTDDQIAAIFEWATKEVRELKPFRNEQGDNKHSGDEREISGKTE